METVDCVVVGAGVIGLAVGRALASRGFEVVVVEAANAIGTETSSRNSEVIHAGIYYPVGSLKARLCVAGRQLLYRYCEAKGIRHRRIGKLIVASSDAEIPILEKYLAQARANGVDDLAWVEHSEASELEPHVRCVRALHSPSTGIIDSHEYLLALQGDLEAMGGQVVLNCRVTGIGCRGSVFEISTSEASTPAIYCRRLVNAAGLHAQEVARTIKGLPAASIPPRHLARGHYYTLSGRPPFRRLVYPVASNAHLGVHVTVDMAGQIRFGPDVSWVDAVDYSFDSSRESLFYAAIRQYYPGLEDGQLQPGYTGIRPKVSGPKEPAADFIIRGPRDHGIAGLVNLYGIESPGLTASLAIAGHVKALLQG